MTPSDTLPTATSGRWQLLRAGIQNVWEYDDQRFVFNRGRLLLRGQNESGKTKALEVLLPFLLDASLHPQRLDPFGSNARAMRWNLLNESNADVTVSIGYVWLELGRVEAGTPKYWTLGAGLKARRSATHVDDWYFATSQRVDSELSLLDRQRVPLTKTHLAEALGERGEVFESAARYRRAVNERLFGFPAEQYSGLVDALLQLRRPQLSKQLDPAELSRILSASLPPLDAMVIGSLAEGFERLDRHRAEREEYSTTLLGVRSFLEVYRGYAGSFVKARALELTRAESAYHAARARRQKAQEDKELAERELQALAGEREVLEREGLEVEERLRALRDSEAFRTVAALDESEKQAQRLLLSAQRVRGTLESSQSRSERTRGRLREAEEEAQRDASALEQERASALEAARGCELDAAHGAIAAALEQGLHPRAEATLAVTLRERAATLGSLRALSRRVVEAAGAVDSAMTRVSQATERVRHADERLAEAETVEHRAREALLEEVRCWAESCRQLQVDAGALLALPPERMRQSLDSALAASRDALDAQVRVAALAHDTAGRELGQLRAERDSVAAEAHRPPPGQPWRSPRTDGRPGAPLYLLCDFQEGLEATGRAGLEAALEAAGLLDAWVMPGGEVLDPATFDVLLQPASRAVSGATLADVLVPTAQGAVPAEVVGRVLRSVGLGRPAGTSAREAWVCTDGRFKLGPLQGRSAKAQATFIGAAAREQARLMKLAELDMRIEALRAMLAQRALALEEARTRRGAVDEEVSRFPDTSTLREHQATTRARGAEAADARTAQAEERARLRKAEEVRYEAVEARDAQAAEAGLRGWVERLDELAHRTAGYELAVRSLMRTDGRARRSAADAKTRRQEMAEGAAELARLSADVEQAEEEAVRAQARAEALRASAGATREELFSRLRASEQRQETVRKALKDNQVRQDAVRDGVGRLRAGLAAEEQGVFTCEGLRKEAEARFRELGRHELIALAGVEPEAPPSQWTYTDALSVARKVDEATGKLDPSEAARDKAWNRVSERHQDLMRSLKPEIRIIPEQLHGITLYRATFNARALTLLHLKEELAMDIATRDRLLGEEERKLFESFLTGEAHEHLREQLRSANALVRRINQQLQEHPTSSGMKMRLHWEVAHDAPPGTKEAVALLFKSGPLMSDADRTALLGFLRHRLEEARVRMEARTLREQLLSVLDYRAWHTFQVECQTGTEGWKPLTRKVHAAGSGGQKAVMLHLPLFAAAAAFYDSAGPGAPRFILLDEAFAGIDKQTRGELMGLLSDFDLDFVMTSFEEWGFYPQLDGLSTYHLSREKGMPGVYSDWFVWNGQEARQMQV